MKLSGNTILITGGSSGIGLAFAERFIQAGNTVIVTGRREQVLQSAKEKLPSLITRVSDLAVESERAALFDWVTANYPAVNVLVNNAGIQQRFHVLKADAKDNWRYFNQELTTNIEAPFHLSMLFAPYFAAAKAKEQAAIINVTSGLAFTPLAIAPIYSATKAALHSFTMSLRHQLAGTSVEVIEVAPPAVNTDLGGAGLHIHGEPLDAFADGIFAGLEEGKPEIGYGSSVPRLRMSRDEIDEYAAKMYEALKSAIE
ncbi:SDR family oxidoreductase [Paenibacillus kobensis]|uniref:SDR family oxidoreductase n=1 Tax=Paenibacillus kobensis TaxID=59841 RepID=UPI000FDBC688|nr:SDR family NAD(P)-dependent oxidoreductase [Paenibacillus kobensis]